MQDTGQGIKKSEYIPRFGFLSSADGYASLKGTCGDTIAICLKIDSDRIVEVSYDTDGCYPSIISAKMAAQLAQGNTVDDAYQVEQRDILNAMGGWLPEEYHHCAHLAAEALKEAIGDYYRHRREGRRCSARDGSNGAGGERTVEKAHGQDEKG